MDRSAWPESTPRRSCAGRGGTEARVSASTTIARTATGYERWTAACRSNDVEPYTRGAEPSVTVTDRMRALREAAAETTGVLSQPTDNEWRAEQDGLYPGRHAIEPHWPSFTAARAIALGKRREVPHKV